jgi:hypothetical protein
MTNATMTRLEHLEAELNEMILDGRILEAFEKFYADDCTLQEGTDDPIVGKDANRAREKMFVEGITEFRGAAVHDVAIGDDVTMSVWHFDYTHGEWGSHTYDQVAVRQWKDGRIVRERFYKAA